MVDHSQYACCSKNIPRQLIVFTAACAIIKDFFPLSVELMTLWLQVPSYSALLRKMRKKLNARSDALFLEKSKRAATFLWELFLSAIDNITLLLNTYNKNYRNIVLQLSAEKDMLSQIRLEQMVSLRNT